MSRRRSSAARSASAPAGPVAPTRGQAPASRVAFAALALGALTLAAYAPALRAGFIWDDDDYVTDNATLETLSGLGRIWLSPGAVPQYYPLTFTSFWLEYRLFGDTPTGYHVTNLLLHGLNAVLVWLVLRRLRVPGAWLAAAIFALHPVHVESVAWISERKNVLSGACYLAALLIALRLADAPTAPTAPTAARDDGRRRRALLVLALFVGALLAKTVTCTLPVVLMLLLWWRRERLDRRVLLAALPLFAIGITLALVTIWMERTHVGARGALWSLSPLERILIAGRALWFYAATLAWPHPLSFVYPRWTIDSGVWWQWLFPIAAAAVAIGLWLARHRLGRWPLVAALGFAVTLAPALGFVDVYPMRYTFVADHYQYLASLFLIAPAAALLTSAARRLVPYPSALTVPVLLILATLTWRHAQVFAGPETLWRDVIAKDPSGAMAHINLGMWLHQHDRSAEAVVALEEALRLEPGDAEVHGDLGIVLAALGRADVARAHLAEAVRLAPDSAQAHNNLANALAGDGRLDEAMDHYRQAVRLKPGYADAHNNLANVLVQQGKTGEAIRHYQAAIAADPGYVAAHSNLATVLTRDGRDDEAITHFQAAVDLDPARADAQSGLGARLAARGRMDEAIPHLAASARLQPRRVEGHYQLAAALAAVGRIDEAIVAYTRALELRPDVADLHNDLGIAFARRGDLAAAIAAFRKALELAPEHVEARGNLAAALAAPNPAATP